MTTYVVIDEFRSPVNSGQRRGRWSGVPLSDRPSRRRDALLAAGIAALGAPDGPALTVRAICREARLTERYFYESFTDREQFARAVYDEVGNSAMAALASASGPRQAVERFVALMVDDPARGRVLLLAPAAEPALMRSGPDWMTDFITLLQQRLPGTVGPIAAQLTAISMIGGLTALFTAYLDGRLQLDRERFIDYCVALLTTRIVD